MKKIMRKTNSTFWTDNRNQIIWVTLLVLFSGIVGFISLGKNFDFDSYNCASGDGYFALHFIKSIEENGILGSWINYRTGAPAVSTLIDFPASSNLDVLLYWIISWFTHSTPSVLYVFLILSFIFDALGMYLLMSKLKIRYEVNFVVSILFSLAPFHFYRYLSHNTLIMYFPIPLAILLGCYILDLVEVKKKWVVVLTVLIGVSYGYYYAFSLIILFIAYVVQFIREDSPKRVAKKLSIMVLLFCVIFLGLAPKIIYGLINGSNTLVGKRVFVEQEIYGLKIIQMLLPVTYSRVGFLRELTAYYSRVAPLVNENSYASIGLISSIGFLSLCVTFIVSFANKKKTLNETWRLIDFISLTTIAFLLLGMIGGFGEIFNWIVTPQIRCYNRSSIVITCLSLIMVAIIMNQIGNDTRKRVLCCSLVLMIGLFDQVNICGENWQEATRSIQRMYEGYFKNVEDSFEEGAMVYQLPYMDFPEVGMINNIPDYKLFAGYLFTEKMRWSYGGVKGRNELARDLNIDNGMSFRFIKAIRDAGFSAIYIDTEGYADGGNEIVSFYDSLGLHSFVSSDSLLYIYDIRGVDIPDYLCEQGYMFVLNWNKKYSMDMSMERCAEIVNLLKDNDFSAMHHLFEGIKDTEIVKEYSDEQYIDFLYKNVLGRGESDEERNAWVATLLNGISREDAFKGFCLSEEFRNRQGFNEEN